MSSASSRPGGDARLAHILLFVTPALWSVNYLVARWAPGVIAPHMLALCRWSLAVLLLGAFCWRELAAKRQLMRAEAGHFVVLGALGMWVCGAFVYIGGRSTLAVNIGLIYAAAPVLIILASALWLHERLNALQGAGIALALAGVLHIVFKGHWADVLHVGVNPGDVWIACAMLCWTAYSLLMRAWPSAFGALAHLTLIACGGVLVLIPFTLWEAVYWLPSTLSWQSAGLVFAAALLPGAAAYGAYSFMLRVLGPARVSSVLYLSPLYSAAIGWAVLGEGIEWFHAIGALLILPGIWLSTRR